ncbi:lipopolysaccharide biosynthesis protein [Alkalibaculum bacchi]|nr:hypothetical protein [Alkalibaculum bacchi]
MRTQKTIRNMLSDIIPFFIMGILGFVKIPIFIDYLGQGYYGFTQIFNQIFNYLNLAEAGFGTSIVFALYSPIADRNRDKINKLLSGAKIIFRRIGIIILTAGLILSFFVDYLIKKNPMSPLYTQIAFVLFLLTGIGNYFAYAPRFLLQADQNKYMTNLVTNIMRIVQILVEIVLLILGIDLIGIFIWYFINMILTNIIINYFAYKSYPWMDLKQEPDMSTVDNTKHVFMQKIATIIASNTDNIVLSAFVGVDVVAIYASYNYIAQFIISITNKIINSTQESFGNFFASKEKKEGLSTFWEMNSFLFYMASIVFTVTYLSINNLIRLWVGSKMLVSQFTVLLFCMVFFYRIVRGTGSVIINGIGAFKETKWQSLFEAIINLSLSLLLVGKFSIDGVLFATIASYTLTGFWFIPNYIFKNVFYRSSKSYFINYGMNVLIMVIVLYLGNVFCSYVGFYEDTTSIMRWFIETTIFTLLVSIVYFVIYYCCYRHFRLLVKRLLTIVKR